MARIATIHRVTGETDVRVTLNLDGVGRASVKTGVGFFDHLLDALSRHSMIDLDVAATGDLHVDTHHTIEDVGLTLGAALLEALGDKSGVGRYGHAVVPMDEALAEVAVDLSGRAAYVAEIPFRGERVGDFPTEMLAEFLKSLASSGRFALHAVVRRGGNDHHVAEGVVKALARALRQAIESDTRRHGVPSTKGVL